MYKISECLCQQRLSRIGKYTDIKKQQEEREKEAEKKDMGMELYFGAMIAEM